MSLAPPVKQAADVDETDQLLTGWQAYPPHFDTVGDAICRASPKPSREQLRGILLFAFGVLLLACMDATVKHLAARYDVPMIVAVRYVVYLLLMLVALTPTHGRRLVLTDRTALVILRACCLAAGSILVAFALQRLPIAESTSILFLAPTIVMLLAGRFLGERIGALGWIASISGFAGVMLIVQPGTGLDPLGVALALTAAVTNAMYQLLSRVLASTESTMAMLFYTALVGSILFGLSAPWFWDDGIPRPIDIALFLSLGIYGGLGHYLFTAAHRYAPASILAPIGYLHVVYAGLLGWLVFAQVPAASGLAGMIIIGGSGALIAIRAIRDKN